jgi:lipopolysaccharide export system protein LptC
MSIAARTETFEQRSAIYDSLVRRNRLVAILRVGLPILGGIVLAGLLVRLYLGSLVPDFGFANITIDRDNLVVEAPAYSGVGADGTVYSVGAASARASIGDTDLIHLTDASFALKQPAGATYEARATKARLRMSSQVVTVDGPTEIGGSDGMTGIIHDAEVEIGTERMRSGGEVRLSFSGGTTVEAATMSYDGKAQLWQFDRATVVLGATPGEYTYALRPPAGSVSETPAQ